MATRTFLTPEELKEAEKKLQPPIAKPNGQVQLDHSLSSALDFSSWLSLKVENRLSEVPGWEKSAPIAIGSWGRGELCPGSDLDVIFCGETKSIEKVVRQVESLGMKFRYRVPDDLNDWTKNVEVLEINALFTGKAFTQEGADKLQHQKELILKKTKSFRRKLLQGIVSERKLRFKRYDSLPNFLEPNLKFGAGGLRDLHQALIVAQWFPERFEDEEYSFKVLDYYKCFYLLIRQRLHLTNSHDILTASDQQDIGRWFGYQRNRDFMMEVQKGLSRVSFHSDWVNERGQLSQKELENLAHLKVGHWRELLRTIQKEPSLQTQAVVRKKLYMTKGFKKEKLSREHKAAFLKKILDVRQSDQVTVAAFRSHLISHLLPNFTKVIGLVQHDQYHRYSVDAHLLQAVREVKRIYEHPKLLGKLQFYGEKLKVSDWNILRWAALYHDIGKGQGEAHEKLGAELALKDLKALGLPKVMIDEVVWLVKSHLILSTAAFRKNPQSPQTWEFLFSQGVRGPRLYRLAMFTVIDILATNPEAWSSWKEALLCELVDTLRNPSQERYFDFSQKIKKKSLAVPTRFIENLDPGVIDNIPERVLFKDFQEILENKELPPLVVRDRKKRIWIRFHRAKDEKGLVLDFTLRLTGIGCNIRQAFIHTDPEMGVYDWFCVKTTKSTAVLKKQLLHNISSSKNYESLFSQVDLVSTEEAEWVFSFRAKDKKGLLLSAIQALHRNDLEIIWAKVHTWGRQIDDIFGVLPKNTESPKQILKILKQKLESPELEIL